MELKIGQNGPQNEPRTRQFPDKIPTPLRDAKREPKWTQNGAKRVLKGSQNPIKIDKKTMKIMQNAIGAAQSRARTPRVAERRPKRPRGAARSLTKARKEADRRGNTPTDEESRVGRRRDAEMQEKTPRDAQRRRKTQTDAERGEKTHKDAERRGKTPTTALPVSLSRRFLKIVPFSSLF